METNTNNYKGITGGKWIFTKWENNVFGNRYEISCPEKEMKICEIPYLYGDAEANAQAIASLPNLIAENAALKESNEVLLDALKEAREYIIKYGKPPLEDKPAHDTLSKIMIAITKSEATKA